MMPIMLAVGMATDYGAATNNHSSMQNALDAATLRSRPCPRP
jgi:Flp pilus assembly protein TadG